MFYLAAQARGNVVVKEVLSFACQTHLHPVASSIPKTLYCVGVACGLPPAGLRCDVPHYSWLKLSLLNIQNGGGAICGGV
jgi:hypothetical protein